MPRIRYDRDEWIPSRTGAQGGSVEGPHPCDQVRKGDLIQVGGSERKVRVVFRSAEEYVTKVWVVKRRVSGYPSPYTQISRHRLKEARVLRSGVDLYSTPLEARLQMALERQAKELEEKAIGNREFQARDEVTESEVVGVLQ